MRPSVYQPLASQKVQTHRTTTRSRRLVSAALILLLVSPNYAMGAQAAGDFRAGVGSLPRLGVAIGAAVSLAADILVGTRASEVKKVPSHTAPPPADDKPRPNGFVVGGDAPLRARRPSAALRAYESLITLPQEEQGSLYAPENMVGTPPGMTTPAAATPPAAMGGQELPGSSNFNFDVPVTELSGRGMSLSLSLSYNSRLWNVSQTIGHFKRMTYNVDKGWPAPGFTLGFGKLVAMENNAYMLTEPDGTRHSLRFSSASNSYVTTDGTFIKYNAQTSTLTDSEGVRTVYTPLTADVPAQYPAKIIDRNGNYMEIFYVNGGPRLDHITDTLGRQINFRYDAATGDLITVEVPGYAGSPTPRQTIRLYYETISINPTGSFAPGIFVSGVSGTARVLRYVYFPGTQSGYRYDYSQPYGMIYRVTQLRGMLVSTTSNSTTGSVTSDGQSAAVTEYNYPTQPSALTDAPTYTRRTDDWAGRTTGVGGNPQQPPYYTFAVDAAAGTTTVTAPDGIVTQTEAIIHPGAWDNGLVKTVKVQSGATVLRSTQTDWETWDVPNAPYNQRVKEVRVTDDAGQTSKTSFVYWPSVSSAFNNVQKVIEKGFGGEELRVRYYTYKTGQSYLEQGLVHLTTSSAVYRNSADADAGVNAASVVEYEYDEGTRAACPGITMLDASYGSVAARGNITGETSYADAAARAGAATHTMSYDAAGNVVSQTVSCCLLKQYSYDAANNYAYRTTVRRGDAGQLTSTSTYDRNTGLVRSSADENGQLTTYDYDPASLRPTKTTQPDGGYKRVEYNDALVDDQSEPDALGRHSYIKVAASIDQSGGVFRETASWKYLDGRGEVARVFVQTPEGYVTQDQEYDVMGRAYRSNNPYTSTSPSAAAVEQTTWTVHEFDGLGRLKKVTTPDNNVVQVEHSGTVTTVTDQAGGKRRGIVNALGQLTRVDEPDSNGNLDGGDINAPYLPAFYQYDVLDNLVTITQGVQQRLFRYDSLGRLTRQKHPETVAVYDDDGNYVSRAANGSHPGATWSDVFAYDADGNMVDSYDARNIHTHLDYTDALGRVRQLTFSDGTPSVRYTYDEAHTDFYNAGRLTKVETVLGDDSVQTAQAFDYDSMGRIAGHRQQVGGDSYSMSYGYNLAGQLVSEKYPSGRVVEQGYDAATRLVSVREQAAGGRVYVSGVTYAPFGGAKSLSLGNGTTENFDYDDKRLLLKEVKLSKGTQPTDVLEDLVYKYGVVDPNTGVVDASKNTGRVAVAENYIGGSLQWQQRFVYDSLGRLGQVSEHPGSNTGLTTYKIAYGYDRYGNRKTAPNQAQALQPYTPVTDADIDVNTNRFTNGVTYDDAGNVTDDSKFTGMRYSYDANSRQNAVLTIGGAVASSAVYDGIGHRVQTRAGSEVRNYVYDAFGRLVAEYANSSQVGGGLKYVFSDLQGSTRVVTDQNGQPLERRDYTPFGDAVGTGVGQRTSTQKYGENVGPRLRYAGLEGDVSGLDHAMWRRYDRSSGRWVGVDPDNDSLSPDNPQTFNRYAYVGNDPVNFVDPTGLSSELCYDVYLISYTIDSQNKEKVTGMKYLYSYCLNSGTGKFDYQVRPPSQRNRGVQRTMPPSIGIDTLNTKFKELKEECKKRREESRQITRQNLAASAVHTGIRGGIAATPAGALMGARLAKPITGMTGPLGTALGAGVGATIAFDGAMINSALIGYGWSAFDYARWYGEDKAKDNSACESWAIEQINSGNIL